MTSVSGSRPGLVSRIDQRRRVRGSSLAATFHTKTIGSRPGNRDGRTDDVAEQQLRFLTPGADPWRVADDLHGSITNFEPGVTHQPDAFREQRRTGRPCPLRAISPEHRTQIAELGRAQQRVAQGMTGDVGVRVPRATIHAVPPQPSNPALAARLDGVDVDTGANTRNEHAPSLGRTPVAILSRIMGQTVAVVLAGGRGTRVAAGRNKVLIEVAGRAVIDWSVRAFADAPEISRTILVAHPDDIAELERLALDYPSVTVIAGGKERADSERAALEHVRADIVGGNVSAVLLHDGARPCVSTSLIRKTSSVAMDCGVLPALPAPRLARIQDGVLHPAPGRLLRAQTPQGAPGAWLLAAYDEALRDGFTGTDTASYLEQAGYPVRVVAGEPANLKVTYSADLERAATILTGRGR